MTVASVVRFFHNVWVKRVLVVLFVGLIFVLGMWFADRPRYSYPAYYGATGSDEAFTSSTNSPYSAQKSFMVQDETTATETTATTQKVIKTGSLSLTVKSTPDTLTAITNLAATYAGFVQSSDEWVQSDKTNAATVTIRLDSANFEQAMVDLKKMATVVESESVSGQDVTEEYVDLQSNLKNLQAEEQQYLTILSKATTVEDLLNVSDYLSRVRGDIEQIQGRLKYLNDRTDFATITISLYEEASVVIPTSDWQPVVVAKQAFNRLVETSQSGVNGVIWIVTFGVPFLIFVWIVRRVVRFFHRRKR